MALALFLGASLVAAPPAGAQANHLKVALQGDTSNVDLHLTTHYVSRVALLNVYEMLYTLGEDLSIQPMLADKHTISPDAPHLHDHGPEGRQVPQRQGDGREGRRLHAQPDDGTRAAGRRSSRRS